MAGAALAKDLFAFTPIIYNILPPFAHNPEAHRDAVTGLFRQRDLAIAEVGRVHPGHRLTLSLEEEAGLFWDLGRTPFIGAPALQSAIQPEPGAHHARSAF